ncbi:MAG: DinB family protein [Bacteroidota bacterium]
MAIFKTSEQLERLRAMNAGTVDFVRNVLGTASDDVLLRKPAPGSWCAIECIEHLNITGGHYVPAMERALAKASPKPVDTYKSGWAGGYMARVVHPKNMSSKAKTPSSLQPKFAADDIPVQEVLTAFLDRSEVMTRLLHEAEQYDIGRIKVNSVVGPILRFNIGDSLSLNVYHERRHIIQAAQAAALDLRDVAVA